MNLENLAVFFFFSYFDALLLMFEERSIYILGYVTTFLGLSFQIWKITVYLLKSCLNLYFLWAGKLHRPKKKKEFLLVQK